jgi:hypothetical protein
LTADDMIAALRTLDQACGADSNAFRWRVRQFVQTQRDLALRRERAEVGRD